MFFVFNNVMYLTFFTISVDAMSVRRKAEISVTTGLLEMKLLFKHL
jgi:hypothetical protein